VKTIAFFNNKGGSARLRSSITFRGCSTSLACVMDALLLAYRLVMPRARR
jgi:hypothetical protein